MGANDNDHKTFVPTGFDCVAAASEISTQIQKFMNQLLDPNVKASHLESVYIFFNEDEITKEMKILSLLDPSGKLQQDVLFNISIFNHGPIVTSGIPSFLVLGTFLEYLAQSKITNVTKLSSKSPLSDFGSYSKKFSSLIDCSHCNRTSPPLYLQIFQLFENADDLILILNKHSVLTSEELSSKLYGNFAASYTVTSSMAQFFISMLEDPTSLWNVVLKPMIDDMKAGSVHPDVNIRDLLKDLHTWMTNNCHSPQRVAADCKSINQLKNSIKAIDELLVSDGDQSALINVISKSNFQGGALVFNLETITVSLLLPSGEDSTIDIPEGEFHRARAEGILLQAESMENKEEQVSRHSGMDDRKRDEFLNMCQLVDETLFILQELDDFGYPIKSNKSQLVVMIQNGNAGIFALCHCFTRNT
ncbi:hypothetical protein GEMRC1_013147 [Eukaryota sp. GEM-RC1]